jgi:ankyrin repeat protein
MLICKKIELLESVLLNNISAVKRLVSEGVDVNFKHETTYMTPLMYACSKGYSEIAFILLAAGADVTLTDKEEATALNYACLMTKDIDIIQMIIRYGVEINNTTKTLGHTPLMDAVVGNNIDAVKLLVKMGAKLDVRDKVKEETALMKAVKTKRENIVEFLVKSGADVNIPNKNGVTPLMVSCYYNLYNTAKLLIEYGADVNAVATKFEI